MTGASRRPAVPSSPRQHARRRRILSVAAELAGTGGDVTMQDVADQAEVALATLYRYFPSKAQLFLGVAADQIEALSHGFVPPSDEPDEAIHALLIRATRYLVGHPTLATAVVEAHGTAWEDIASEADEVQEMMHDLLLSAAGRDEPGDAERHLMRLVVQNWFGVLQTVLNGRLTLEQGDEDLRLACRLLLAPLRDPDHALAGSPSGAGTGR